MFGWLKNWIYGDPKWTEEDAPQQKKSTFDKKWSGRCSLCGCEEWYEGPSGGLSQNLYCGNMDCDGAVNIMNAPGGPYLDMEFRRSKPQRTKGS